MDNITEISLELAENIAHDGAYNFALDYGLDPQAVSKIVRAALWEKAEEINILVIDLARRSGSLETNEWGELSECPYDLAARDIYNHIMRR